MNAGKVRLLLLIIYSIIKSDFLILNHDLHNSICCQF